jgi:hypothetical protein
MRKNDDRLNPIAPILLSLPPQKPSLPTPAAGYQGISLALWQDR